MPELPELEIYARRLSTFVGGKVVRDVIIAQPFVLRTVDPPVDAISGRTITGVERRGKRLMFRFDGDAATGGVEMFIHLMRSGRLHWVRGKPLHRSTGCARWRFDDDWSLNMTEASTHKQASIHLHHVQTDPDPLDEIAGLDPLSWKFTVDALSKRLRARNQQIKGALTSSTIVAGIGNAYSDEILFDAHLSPLHLTHKLSPEQFARLHESMGGVLRRWIERIDQLTPDRLPTDQRTWRKEFAVHGRFKKTCPKCEDTIARISFAESDTNYCPGCQTGGRVLADRRMSRLLRR